MPNKSIKKRGGAGGPTDYISVGFIESPISKTILSMVDVFKGPASIFGAINYAAANIEEALGLLKSNYKDKNGNPIKVQEKKVSIEPINRDPNIKPGPNNTTITDRSSILGVIR